MGENKIMDSLLPSRGHGPRMNLQVESQNADLQYFYRTACFITDWFLASLTANQLISTRGYGMGLLLLMDSS